MTGTSTDMTEEESYGLYVRQYLSSRDHDDPWVQSYVRIALTIPHNYTYFFNRDILNTRNRDETSATMDIES